MSATAAQADASLLAMVPADVDEDMSVVAWLRGGAGLVGWGAAWRGTVTPGPGRFARAAEEAESALADLGPNRVAVAAFTFDPGAEGSTLLVPQVVRRPSGGAHRGGVRGATPEARPASRIRYAGSSLPELQWLDAVAEGIAAVRAGDVDKVVLARDVHVWSEQPLRPVELARRLAAANPQSWTFCIDGLVGATPELLLRRRGRDVSSLALAGTAARGADEAADGALGEALRRSAKDREEHAFSVSSVREGLSRFASEVTADAEPWLLRLPHVQHLATWVRGRLTEPASALALAGSLHPTAAVCGTPTASARDLLTRLERLDRARYAGPVGWVDANGDGEFGIALRCAEISREGDRGEAGGRSSQVSGTRARIFAGVGIVAGSLPEAELEETRLKLLAMQTALEG